VKASDQPETGLLGATFFSGISENIISGQALFSGAVVNDNEVLVPDAMFEETPAKVAAADYR
jgi:hypothetical protein